MNSTEKINLLIIDPQCDFIDAPYEGSNFGRLPVVGANRDIKRICNLINKYNNQINKIVVSLDTHTIFHIGHKFWREIKADGTDGEIAPGGTTFSVENDKIKGSDNKYYEVNVTQEDRPAMNAYALAYLKKVIKDGSADGRNLPCTWPIHCIQGTNGWKIQNELANLLQSMPDKVEYHIKGQNQLAEMYSIMKAEIPYEDVIREVNPEYVETIKNYIYNPSYGDNIAYSGFITPNNITDVNTENLGKVELSEISEFDKNIYDLKTTFNNSLFESLTNDNATIWVCGEALSHCVQFSTRDIVKEISNKKMTNKVFLIQNASSYVNLDAIGLKFLTNIFKDSAHYFIEGMKCSNIYKDVYTGTKEINFDNTLIDVPCIKTTNSSELYANNQRSLSNTLRLKGGTKKIKKPKRTMKKNFKKRKLSYRKSKKSIKRRVK